MNKISRFKLLIIAIILVAAFTPFYAQGGPPKPDDVKVEDPKGDKKDKEGEEEEEAEGAPVAFLPFHYSFSVGKKNGQFAKNEIVVSMQKSGKFKPVSMKVWSDEKFTGVDDKGRSNSKTVNNIVDLSVKLKIPAEYICHGYLFQSGKVYGLKVALYPLDEKRTQKPQYFYRTFNDIYQLNEVADQIVDEMVKRLEKPEEPLFKKKLFIQNFKVNFTQYAISDTGEETVTELPFFKYKKMELRNTDHFFHNLMMYNFHSARIFEVWDNNMYDYVNMSAWAPEEKIAKFDYILSGHVDISNEKSFITIEVRDSSGAKKLYRQKFHFDSLELEDLYQLMRIYTNDITLKLLNEDEKELVGELTIGNRIGDNFVFLNNYYLGKGEQKNLLVPAQMSTVTYWYGENVKSEKFMVEKMYESQFVNVISSKPNKAKQPFFRMSLGGTLLGGFYFHPQYDDKSEVIFVEDREINFYMGDLVNNIVVKESFPHEISYKVGLGFDFSMMSDYFMLTNQFNFQAGHYQNEINLAPEKEMLIDKWKVSDMELKYKVLSLNFSANFDIMPAVMFLKKDSPVRMYVGQGFFLGFTFNQLTEEYEGLAVVDNPSPLPYTIKVKHSQKQSASLSLGIYPEFGTVINISRFNIKTGIAYYLPLFKYNFHTNTRYGVLDSFNDSQFVAKVSFGYFIK